MTTPLVSTNFGDLLDPRFQKIFYDEFDQLPDKIPELFGMPPDNGRADMRWSDVGAFGDWDEFSGTVAYNSMNQGYDTTATHREFVSGCQVERKLYDDDQYNIIDQRPQNLATAAQRTRQKHAARIWNNAFLNDTYFYSNSEGVALCSTAHTTNAPGISTASGFSNKTTAALSSVAVSASRIQMQKFRDDRGNKFMSMPDTLRVPIDLQDQADEIVKSTLKPDTANNNINVHKSKYEINSWIYITDTNDWFLEDARMRKKFLQWIDRVKMEFKQAEDIDTLVSKWRGYMRYSNAMLNWRWVIGSQVT